MPSINVSGAAARLLAFGTNTPGYCLQFVWRAISQSRVHYISGGAASAYATWQATDPNRRHNGDRNVPKDMPAFFGPRPGNALGDVIISNGDGTFTATDRPNGHVGICTLAQRGIQIGRPYLGWSETMGGYDLTTTGTASSSSTPLTPVAHAAPPAPIFYGGSDMAFYYGNTGDGKTVGRFSDGGVKIFGNPDDYNTHKASVDSWLTYHPEQVTTVTSPPPLSRPTDAPVQGCLVWLSQHNWDIECAIRGHVF